jgi:hypothetical protein
LTDWNVRVASSREVPTAGASVRTTSGKEKNTDGFHKKQIAISAY